MELELMCKYCDGTQQHEFINSSVEDELPVIRLKCLKCNSVHLYSYLASEFQE